VEDYRISIVFKYFTSGIEKSNDYQERRSRCRPLKDEKGTNIKTIMEIQNIYEV